MSSQMEWNFLQTLYTLIILKITKIKLSTLHSSFQLSANLMRQLTFEIVLSKVMLFN